MNRIPAHLFSGVILAAGMIAQGGLWAQTAQVRAKVPAAIPPYQAQAVVKGTFELLGTDALSDLGDEWAASLRKVHPEANLVFKSKLTKEAVAAFMEGTNLLIITAREFTAEEGKAFQTKYGYMPMRIPICLDANIVFVHKNNPLTSISMEQLDAIYSKSRLGGAKTAALVWGDLGLRGEWAKLPIHAYARAEGTATRSSFAEKALLNGEYRAGILDRNDASALAEAVMTDPAGIAFGTMSSWYFANKVLPVTPYHGEDARFPNQDNVTTSKYPMPRLYYAYLNRAPGAALPPAVNEVIHFLLSREGQTAVADAGLLPGPPEFITIALKRLSR
ncbi:PstS family phosphate ABC transporter substrate-binding protein [Geothrix sp. PMB-07]|uniref:PstS family phosphate ABC transporter substrate-binding protein n=1 Tax=Geothrix sp. PMB-07 TaxID=3068640 RepID=UPI002742730B|nr:substrate-binding domain-containing protein [Geothrix sp. PMB-07]WLT32866.1 substrate-binding domain-containing protein [Geothrix sp. PMB-07]